MNIKLKKSFEKAFHMKKSGSFHCNGCGGKGTLKANDAKKPTVECFPCKVDIPIA